MTTISTTGTSATATSTGATAKTSEKKPTTSSIRLIFSAC
jgi:hypothetical protein